MLIPMSVRGHLSRLVSLSGCKAVLACCDIENEKMRSWNQQSGDSSLNGETFFMHVLSCLLLSGFCFLRLDCHPLNIGQRLPLDFALFSDDDDQAFFDRHATNRRHVTLDSHSVFCLDD